MIMRTTKNKEAFERRGSSLIRNEKELKTRAPFVY